MEIKENNILAAYDLADEQTKGVLRALFPEQLKEQEQDNRPITERVKTFEDAVAILGNSHPYVMAWNSIYQGCENADDEDIQDVIAYHKLRIIVAALNEGWKPTFTEDEYRYFPWFYLYTKDEYDRLDEDEKKECRAVLRSSYNASACGGLVCSYANFASSGSYAYGGSRLALKTRELAMYCGKQFIDIWMDFVI